MNMSELIDVEVEILNDFYERDFNRQTDMKINHTKYDLTEADGGHRVRELASILKRLERLHYLNIGYNAFSTGGMTDDKYQNNVIMIWVERINMTHRGRLFIEDSRKPKEEIKADSGFLHIVGKSLKWFVARVLDELVSILISGGLGIALGYYFSDLFN